MDDTILGPLEILPVKPNLPIEPSPPPVVAANSLPPSPTFKANPFILFLILILLLAAQGQLATAKRNAKLNRQDEPSIS